jgi:hypothetical protein
VLKPGPERDQLVRAIRLAGARFTSRSSAQGLAEAYSRALRASVTSDLTVPSAELQELRAERDMLRRELSSIYDDPLNRGLAGRYAVLPPELRRPVLAVAMRPALRKTAIGLYRAGHALRTRRGLRSGTRNGAPE